MAGKDSTRPYNEDNPEEEKEALDDDLGSRQYQSNPKDKTEREEMQDSESGDTEKEYNPAG